MRAICLNNTSQEHLGDNLVAAPLVLQHQVPNKDFLSEKGRSQKWSYAKKKKKKKKKQGVKGPRAI
jgi:hypothetical protein